MRWAVLGPGGVGGLVAAALHRAGEEVSVVARPETVAEIAARGIRVESILHGNHVARPRAVAALAEPVDVLVVATKATGLEEALERVEDAAIGEPVILPLLNGLEHLEALRERFGPAVCAATIRVEADRPEPGRVVQTSPFLRVEMASEGGVRGGRLRDIAGRLDRAGIPSRVLSSEADVMWSKLTRLCALATTTSASGLRLGDILADVEWRSALEGAVAEAAAVARAEGASVDGQGLLSELEESHPTLGSSMQRDLESGRPTELDAIAGAVMRAGARHDIGCPTIARLAGQVEEREASG